MSYAKAKAEALAREIAERVMDGADGYLHSKAAGGGLRRLIECSVREVLTAQPYVARYIKTEHRWRRR